jgi:ABC-2 type transport system permease protein
MTTAMPPARGLRVTQPRVTYSEWIKLRSLRSALWTLYVSVALTAGIALILCFVALLNLEAGHGLGSTDPAAISLYGVYAAQLTYGVLGVLLATSEYSSGTIRSTLTAVPRRLPVLGAKLGVYAAVALVTSEAALAVGMLAGQGILSARHAGASLSDPGVARAMIGAGLYLTVTGLIGVALGFLIRNAAGAIMVQLGILLVLSVLWGLLPAGWARHVTPYLPGNAGQAVLQLHPSAGTLAPWTGFAVYAGYAVLAAGAAALFLIRRDA